MGRLAKLLQFTRVTRNGAQVSDVTADPGGEPNVTAENFQPAGDDSYPLPGDYVALNSDSGSGRETVIGYVDPKGTPKSGVGEKRIYARNSGGASIVELWLKNTGEAVLSNENGDVTLQADGGVVTQTPGANFSVKADGSIKGSNSNGSFELQASGDFIVNGVTIDVAGNITTPANVQAASITADSMVVDGKQMASHVHPAGTPPGNTGTNI